MTAFLKSCRALWRRGRNRWQPIETAPRNGELVEARNAATVDAGLTFKARWGDYRNLYTGVSATGWHTDTGHECTPEEWRRLEDS